MPGSRRTRKLHIMALPTLSDKPFVCRIVMILRFCSKKAYRLKVKFSWGITRSKLKTIYKRKSILLKLPKNYTKLKLMSLFSAKSSTNNNSPNPKHKTSPHAKVSSKKANTQFSTKIQSTFVTKVSANRTLSTTLANATPANLLPFKKESAKCSIKSNGHQCCKNSSAKNCIWFSRS